MCLFCGLRPEKILTGGGDKLISIKEIEEKLKDRQIGTIDRHRFFSVTIPLVEKPEGICLLFEVRAASLKAQPGDICFPGGKIEPGETPKECALRETEEETGIPASGVKILGQFDTLHSFSGYTLYTFPAAIDEKDLEKAKINRDEVQELFTVPIDFFKENEAKVYDVDVLSDVKDFPYEESGISPSYNWRKGKNILPVYRYGQRVIWGVTARIVRSFVKKMT